MTGLSRHIKGKLWIAAGHYWKGLIVTSKTWDNICNSYAIFVSRGQSRVSRQFGPYDETVDNGLNGLEKP